MKTGEITLLFERFEAAASEYRGVECWSARELQKLLGYSKWENFLNAIERAKEACVQAGGKISDHFPDVRKVIEAGKGAEHQIDDILLSRYASYLLAQNGDPRKSEIAFAQNYFAVQTRRAELSTQRLPEYERVKARAKLAAIGQEHVDNNLGVRKIMIERGLVPESLPPAEDVKKVERRLASDKKKLLK